MKSLKIEITPKLLIETIPANYHTGDRGLGLFGLYNRRLHKTLTQRCVKQASKKAQTLSKFPTIPVRTKLCKQRRVTQIKILFSKLLKTVSNALLCKLHLVQHQKNLEIFLYQHGLTPSMQKGP